MFCAVSVSNGHPSLSLRSRYSNNLIRHVVLCDSCERANTAIVINFHGCPSESKSYTCALFGVL